MSTRRLENFLGFFNVDNISDFVNKYLIQIVVSFIIVGIVIFAFIFVGEQRDSRDYKLTEKYYRAVKADDVDMLREIYGKKGNNINTRAISGLKLADMLKSENNYEEAKSIYKNIFDFKKVDLFFKNLAGLNLLNILINENDSGMYSEIEKLLVDLKKNDPLLNLVLEQEAMFEIQRGGIDQAKIILNDLLNKDIDADMNTRVQILLSLE